MNQSELKNELRNKILEDVRKYYELAFDKDEFVPGETKVNYGGRFFDQHELVNLVDSSLDFWLTTGRYSIEFEKKMAKFLGIRFIHLVNSGSSANLLAFMALTSDTLGERKVERGDEVITVAAGFPTTVAPIIQYGAVPVFVDIELPSYNINPSMLKEALSPKTKAVFVAHTLGNPFDIEKVSKFCKENNLWLIEDNCDALGSTYNGQYTGSYGDIATCSFYPPHHMTMGEGGMVMTNNKILSKLVASLRDWGRDCWCKSGKDNTCGLRFDGEYGELPKGYDHKYVYSEFGYNLKVTDMQASIGVAQIDKLPTIIERRRSNFQYLLDSLRAYSADLLFAEPYEAAEPSWFGFPITIKDASQVKRSEIVDFLEKNLIQTRMLFAGNLIKHPAFDRMRKEKTGYRVVGELTNTNKVMNDTFWLGVYPGMTEEKLKYIVERFKDFFESQEKK